MAAYSSFNVGDAVKVVRKGLLSTGKRGEVVWKRRGMVGVKIPGINGTLSFNPSSLERKKNIDFFVDAINLPFKTPAFYKVGCEAVKQVLQQTFDSEEAALKRATEWSQQLGGKSVQLYKQVAEYEVKLTTQLVRVN